MYKYGLISKEIERRMKNRKELEINLVKKAKKGDKESCQY
ncbi:hypothetical protein MPD5_0524 [Melissococcus plutonius DAT561]|nr:hypothetical protein MPD5_0524 [Melissococcus plutonius DAT561]